MVVVGRPLKVEFAGRPLTAEFGLVRTVVFGRVLTACPPLRTVLFVPLLRTVFEAELRLDNFELAAVLRLKLARLLFPYTDPRREALYAYARRP